MFYVLHELFHVPTLYSNIISFSVSVVYNYIASVKWVFDVKKTDPKNYLDRFL